MQYNPSTELDAVNIMLQIIGEQPVNTLPVEGFYEASLAQSTLNNVSREVQSSGLHCNQEYGYPLPRLEDGTIVIADNFLIVLPDSPGVAQRGTKLYDLTRHSYMFDNAQTATVVLFLPFNELPQHVKTYITIKAARKMLVELVGSTDLYQQTQVQEMDALLNFKRQELRLRRLTMLHDPALNEIATRGRNRWL